MERKKRNEEQEAKARKKVVRNYEILGMLKAGVSANKIAKSLAPVTQEQRRFMPSWIRNQVGIVIARLARIESLKQVNELTDL